MLHLQIAPNDHSYRMAMPLEAYQLLLNALHVFGFFFFYALSVHRGAFQLHTRQRYRMTETYYMRLIAIERDSEYFGFKRIKLWTIKRIKFYRNVYCSKQQNNELRGLNRF